MSQPDYYEWPPATSEAEGNSIERIKENVSIEDLIRHYGGIPGRVMRCPWHDDRRPSAAIREGRFTCYACAVSGDVIDIVQWAEGLGTVREALKWLNTTFTQKK